MGQSARRPRRRADPPVDPARRPRQCYRQPADHHFPQRSVPALPVHPGLSGQAPAGADDAAVDALLQQTPQLEHAAGDRANRRFFGPTFSGTLAPDLTFFAFDVTPSALDQYWLVLDEPPAELRFRSDAAANAANSATFARTTLDQPTRIAISGAELERQGLNP